MAKIGESPYETQGLSLERVIEVVLHEQPGRPSASPASETGPLPYAKTRLRGDLDALVLKAMSKEPAKRYASASELAGDITRWLKGEPVLARTPSAGYILRRMALRHKRLATVSALALVSVLAASGVAVWQWRVARSEQARRCGAAAARIDAGARKHYLRAHEILRPLLTNSASFEVVRSVVDADLRLSGIALTKREGDQAIASTVFAGWDQRHRRRLRSEVLGGAYSRLQPCMESHSAL